MRYVELGKTKCGICIPKDQSPKVSSLVGKNSIQLRNVVLLLNNCLRLNFTAIELGSLFIQFLLSKIQNETFYDYSGVRNTLTLHRHCLILQFTISRS